MEADFVMKIRISAKSGEDDDSYINFAHRML